jgi:hypothetical protein
LHPEEDDSLQNSDHTQGDARVHNEDNCDEIDEDRLSRRDVRSLMSVAADLVVVAMSATLSAFRKERKMFRSKEHMRKKVKEGQERHLAEQKARE